MKKIILKYFGFIAFAMIILNAGMKIDASQCNHLWKEYDTDYIDNKDGTHNKVISYYCQNCDEERQNIIPETCEGKLKYIDELDDNCHKLWGDCDKCDGELSEKQDHDIKWRKTETGFMYSCTCSYMPLYNGSWLSDYSYKNNITIKKNKKYEEYLWNYNSSKNKIKSIKISNKKICAVSHKKDRLYIKGKKKGKCTVTVKMQSGATYTFPIRVK